LAFWYFPETRSQQLDVTAAGVLKRSNLAHRGNEPASQRMSKLRFDTPDRFHLDASRALSENLIF